jgi:hypothetical protein
MRKLLIIAFFLSSISITEAQECSQLLSQGIYDIRSSASDLNTASSFSQWFCDNKFSSSDQANEFGASLGLPFKGIPVKLGFNSSSQSWSQWYSSFCGSIKSDQVLQSKVRDHVQTINPQIIQAFNQCIQSDGLHVWLERTYDPRTFRFVGLFNSPDPELSPTTKITTFDTGKNVSCKETPKIISKNEWRARCERKDDKPITIVVNATKGPIRGGGTLDLPEIARFTSPPPPPAVERLNTLFVGQTPNCNAAIVTNHQNHLNCTNTALGYTIKNSAAAQQLLYLGVTGNVNAGVITTKSNFKGGATQEWGYTIRESYKLSGSAPLYVVVGCSENDGEVTTNPTHKNCPTTPIGWAYPW